MDQESFSCKIYQELINNDFTYDRVHYEIFYKFSDENFLQTVKNEISKFIYTFSFKDKFILESLNKNIIQVPETNIMVVSDLHSNTFSTKRILIDATKFLKENKNNLIIFLGDYIDKGFNPLLCLFAILGLYETFPHQVILLKGNHEEMFYFKYINNPEQGTSLSTYKNLILLFEHFRSPLPIFHSRAIINMLSYLFKVFPLCAINKHVIFCHGIPNPTYYPKISFTKNKLYKFLVRNIEDEENNNLYYSLLWGDIHDSDQNILKTERGSLSYSTKLVFNYMKQHNIGIIVRGHQFTKDGHVIYRNDNKHILTIFSGANQRTIDGNKGAYCILNYNSGRYNFMIKTHCIY